MAEAIVRAAGNDPAAQAVLDAATEPEMRARLGEWLGAARPVPEAVLLGALLDPRYARRLAVARGFPRAVEHLLASPPALPAGAARRAGLARAPRAPDSLALVRRAAGSLLRWAAGGLQTVDAETRARRWEACTGCPHLAAPPDQGVYRLARAVKPDALVCGLCGCVASAKVRLPHERCPDAHPSHPELTRWGEPRPAAEQS